MNRKSTLPNSPGGRIRALRMAHGFSQGQLAKKIGVTQGAISQFELGNTKGLKAETLIALTAALQTNAHFIFKGQSGPNDATARESVTLDERELLHYWRNLPVDTQQTVLRMVRAAAQETTSSAANPFPVLVKA